MNHPLLYPIPKFKPKRRLPPMPTTKAEVTLGDVAETLARVVKSAESFGLRVRRASVEMTE